MAAKPIGGAGSDGGYKPLAEINVTPFVDVMLVLLIIFMVTAPLMTAGIKVALPKTAAARTLQPKEPLVISLDAEGAVFLAKEKIEDAAILPRLTTIHDATPDRIVLVRGDRTLNYGRIVEVMGLVSRAGFARVSLVAETPPAPRK